MVQMLPAMDDGCDDICDDGYGDDSDGTEHDDCVDECDDSFILFRSLMAVTEIEIPIEIRNRMNERADKLIVGRID